MAFAIHRHESATSLIWNPLPPPTPPCPSGLSQGTGLQCPASCMELELVICFTCNIHVPMLFSQIILPSPSPTESKSLFFTSVSLESEVKVKVTQLYPIFAIPWTIQSMKFSRPEYWSR